MDNYDRLKINMEDLERLQEVVAQFARAAAESFKCVIAAISEFYQQTGMTAQEVQEALYGAIKIAQEAEKQQRNSIYKPPKQPQRAISAVCKSNPAIYQKGRPTARSSPRRSRKKQG